MKKHALAVTAMGLTMVSALWFGSREAHALPPIKKTATAPVSNKLQIAGAAALSAPQKLSFLKTAAPKFGLVAPAQVDGAVRLSARSLYVAGKADLNVNCARSISPERDEIVPSPLVASTFAASAATPCAGGMAQTLRVRFNAPQPNKPVLLDFVLTASTTSTINLVGGVGVQTVTLAKGETGHFLAVAAPKKAGWASFDFQLKSGAVVLRSVEVTPTH